MTKPEKQHKFILMERFNPLNDYLFLKIMGEKGDEVQLLAFLNAVLADSRQKPIKLVKILENRVITPEILGNKTSILDIHALTDENDKAEIEVQLKDLHNMEKRTLLYWAREYTQAISAGVDYSELPRVITINIVNFDNIKLNRFHTIFHIREDIEKDYVLTDVLEIHFLNMVKFRKTENKDIKNNVLCRCLTYFDEKTPENELMEVIKMDAAIQKANERLNFVTQDKDFLRNYHMRQMEMSDWTTGINTAIEKNKLEMAKNALTNGFSADVIHGITGLSIDDIMSLQNDK
ncbi:MAG: Rpn family recombination-promoting nuclease/putative transposase [Treponema sp.]|nr:Rpn family recombination-promoting nuclease/putative transposase [Treponema sp.]